MKLSVPNPGLSLPIAAILLAVIVALGFIFSGHRNQRLYREHVNATGVELAAIAHNMRDLFLHSATVDVSGGADMTLSATDAKHTVYIESGVFPASMILPGRRAVISPWGGGVAVAYATLEKKGDGFDVSFDGVPQAACADILLANAGVNRDPLLAAVGVGPEGAAPAISESVPVTAAKAAELCAAKKDAMGFRFRLRGANATAQPVMHAEPRARAEPKAAPRKAVIHKKEGGRETPAKASSAKTAKTATAKPAKNRKP